MCAAHDVSHYGGEEVEGDDNPHATDYAEEGDDYTGEGDERIAKLVAAPAPLLELKGKHGQLADQKEACEHYEQQYCGYHPCRRLDECGLRDEQ